MQLAPLRPRRRRQSAAELPAAALQTTAAATRPTNLSAIAARIAGLIDGPVSEALVVMLTELYGDALARVLAAIDEAADSAAILDRLCADRLIGGLLVVHDLHPQSLAVRVQGALSAVTPTLAQPSSVTLDRIEDDVVYLRLTAGAGSAERSAIVCAIAELAPEITRVCTDVALEDEFANHA